MVIALLTDFGTKDYFVGAMKGAIFSINEKANIVDITHDIPPQNIAAASFTLRACYKNFPEKTTFVAVVDPGVGSQRRAILVETGNYYFIAPDNGLLSFVFNEEKNFKVFELTEEKFFAPVVSRTFHGRDIFTPAAAHLSKGIDAKEFGAEIRDYVHSEESKLKKLSETATEAEIIHIDRFGNLVTNLRKSDLPESFTLKVGAVTVKVLREFFAEAETGELFLIEGSAGFLEIAAFQASASKILSAKTGEKLILTAV
jgi:S-adenosylmethionine hydrolase